MSGICPKCGRDYSSPSITCRFCNCKLIDRKSYSSYQQPQKQISPQKTPMPQISSSETVVPRPESNRPYKKKKISFLSLTISSICCFIAIIILLSSGDSQSKKSVNANKIESESTEILTKEETIQKAIEDIIGQENLILFQYVSETNYCFIRFKARENLTSNLTISGMYSDIFHILEALQPIANADITFKVDFTLSNIYGETSEVTVIRATFNKETVQKINFENAYAENIPSIADKWWNDDILNESD